MPASFAHQIVIADEPTTALDVMVQAQILELLEKLCDRLGLSIILVTHDLGVVAETCDTVLVMYGGVTAEYASVDDVFNNPQHPYTRELLNSFPDLSRPTDRLASIPGFPPRLDALLPSTAATRLSRPSTPSPAAIGPVVIYWRRIHDRNSRRT